jgi:Ni2+-binding GTPase involved in maturation of urease and hydrogenase
VLVESVCKNLQTLAMAVASQNAVLLEGPIGCGKTSLVEHLAAMTGRRKPPQLLKVQLGDQTDSKVIKKGKCLWVGILVNTVIQTFLLREYMYSYCFCS